MEFIFEIADKHRDRTWVKYPRTFKSKESVEDFKKRFLEAAPAWRLTRITEVVHFLSNAEVEAPLPASASDNKEVKA